MQRGRIIPEAVSKGSRTVSTRSRLDYRHQNGRLATSTAYANRRQQHFFRSVVAVAFAGGVATASQYYLNNHRFIREGHAETLEETEPRFEQSKKRKGASKEEIRDLISSQHLQVKRSWENPGVYAWGSNAGRVVAPDSTEAFIKTPRRMKWFDNQLLRDLKLDKMFGAAIDEYGNLLQWGTAYAQDCMAPAKTLRGKDLVSLSLSRDRIIALSSSGKVYSVPVSREDQEAGSKPNEASWIPFWNGKSPISYRKIAPKDLAWNEKVTKVTSGLEHMLMITNKGRIFSAAAASDSFPARGQFGIPGLTWLTKPDGPYDMPHEIKTLKGFEMTDIACGDYHSLALDKEGRVFGFGDNSSGQLGFEYSSEANAVDVPTLLPTTKLYSGSSQTPKVTSLAAGGSNSYFTIDATKVAPPGATADEIRGVGRVSADTFSFGSGIWGNLGNGRWTHVQSTPTKIPSLSSLFEYDEIKNQTIPIRLAYLSVGATHAAAVMDNVTYMDASAKSSENDTNWGADIVFWGNNEFFQLGTGKRNNYWFFCEVFYAPATTLLKVSVGLFLLRITPSKVHIWIIRLFIAGSLLFGTFYWFLIIFQCNPVSFWWDLNPNSTGKCISPTVFAACAYIISALNTAADLVFTILPMFLVWKTSMTTRTRALVCSLLGLGSIAGIATIVRIPYLHTLNHYKGDFLWNTTEVAMLCTVEIGLGITAASAATFRPLVQRWIAGSNSATYVVGNHQGGVAGGRSMRLQNMDNGIGGRPGTKNTTYIATVTRGDSWSRMPDLIPTTESKEALNDGRSSARGSDDAV